jgi:hypothetical protein
MTDRLRRAGRGRLPDGSAVVWSVAEGERGRRWREVRARDGAILSSLLFETDPDRCFSHLELSTPAGLLTLHPEGDGTIHGNTIISAGVGHVRGLPWSPDGVVVVEGSPITTAVADWSLRRLPPDRAALATVLRISLDLELELAVGQEQVALGEVATADGLPVVAEAEAWPLEE